MKTDIQDGFVPLPDSKPPCPRLKLKVKLKFLLRIVGHGETLVMSLVNLQNISLGFGGHPLLDEVRLTIESGERVCLLGRNGSGKSTLLKLINGEILPDSGEIIRRQGVRISRLTQEVDPGLTGKIYEVVAEKRARESDPLSEEWDIRPQVETILSRMDLDPKADFNALSAGLKRRVLLARALVADPDLLLLDEPTNHLDISAIRWLEEFLLRHVKALLFVTHDRMFLRKLATRIIELDRGRLRSWNCGYDTFLERKAAALETESEHWTRFDKKLAREETWIRRGVKARRTRNEGRVRALEKMREERRLRRERMGAADLQAQEARRTGKLVIETENIAYHYDGRPIIQNFSTTIQRGDKIGIIGPNGAGKTTLLNLLLGHLPPDTGTVRHGVHLEIAYFDQLRVRLDESRSVQDNVADGNDQVVINGKPRHIIGYLGDFLFPPDRARSPVSMLSGGERNRLLLAKIFAKPANVLVLDEPTNDLDLETLEMLENLLVEYTGTLLLVSHDRVFLNHVVTGVFAFEGDAEVNEYVGGYDDWLEQRPESEPVPEKTAAPSPEPKPRAERPRKLSYKERQELENFPGRIEALEAEQAELQRKLSDPAVYKTEGGEVAGYTERLEALEAELEAMYARWEVLEDLAE